MINSSIANHHRYKAYALYFVCVLLVLSASGCGDQTSDQAKTAPSGTGAASFSIQWHSTDINRNTVGSQVHYAIEDCSALGIESITCDVYGESNTPIAHGGPWPCDAHGGRIESIPAGSGRTFAVLGWNGAGADGDVIYQGQTAGIIIAPGEIADTGDIDAYPFIPQLSNPADGQTVAINSFSLTWDSVPNAYGYRILVSEDSSFAAPLVDERKTETTYAPLNLLPSTTYYWMIRSIDLYGNESADSQIRHFITSELEGCQAPVLDPIGNRQVDEAETLSFIINATDPDGGVLTYSANTRPPGASFDPETHTFSWTPENETAGNYSVTFEVCDDCPEAPLCDSEQITITVGDVCRPPVLNPIGNRQVDENNALTFTINATDPDGGVLTYSANTRPPGASFDPETRTFSWTPGYDTADNYTAIFEVCDDCPEAPLCDSEQITITVGDVCRPPVLAGIGNRQVNEGQILSFTLSASNPDGGVLTYSANTRPPGASFDPETRTFSWTPGYDTADNYTAIFEVCDDCPEAPLCDSEQITITVGDVCRPPVLAGIGNRQVNEGQILNFTLSASDPDGGVLTYSANTLPPGANFDPETRTFTWKPGADAAGTYNVDFSVCDDCSSGALCDTERVTITVQDVACNPDPPELEFVPSEALWEGDTVTRTIATTVNPDSPTLTYDAEDLPRGAQFDPDTRIFSWTPDENSADVYYITFTVCDTCTGQSLCDETRSGAMIVGDTCEPPVLDHIGSRQVAVGDTLEITPHGTDPEGDTLQYWVDYEPSGSSWNPVTHVFSWTPTSDDIDTHYVRFVVDDECYILPRSDYEDVAITVTP